MNQADYEAGICQWLGREFGCNWDALRISGTRANILNAGVGSLPQYRSMNRDLEIALVSGALAIFWGYALQLRLREGFVQPIWKPITRQNNPTAFWTVMLFGALGEVVFVGLAVTHFLTWL